MKKIIRESKVCVWFFFLFVFASRRLPSTKLCNYLSNVCRKLLQNIKKRRRGKFIPFLCLPEKDVPKKFSLMDPFLPLT